MTRRLLHPPLLVALVLALSATPLGAETPPPPPGVHAGLETALTAKKIDDRLGALVELGSALGLPEIADALARADDLPQLRERVVFTETVLKRWGELAPAEAFARIAVRPEGATKVGALRAVVPAYAAKDIRALAAAVLEMPPGRARAETVLLVAEEWAKRDLRAALRWVNDLPEGFPRERALRNVRFIWVHQDPAGISPVVRELPFDDTKQALIINVAGNWAVTDADAAIRWAESLPTPAERLLALETVAESWADADPVAATAFAMKLAPADSRQRALLTALERWATQDPEAAIAWLAKTPDDLALQERGVARVLEVFVPVAPEAAGLCVERLAPGPLREHAIETYIEAVRPWDPGAGVRMAMRTPDPRTSERLAQRPFRAWLAWDPRSAKQWLDGAAFREEVKTRWLADDEAPDF